MKQTASFWICLFTSLGLFVGGFLVPPLGVIDGSILKAVGEILGLATIGQIPLVIEGVEKASFSKGDMTIALEKDK